MRDPIDFSNIISRLGEDALEQMKMNLSIQHLPLNDTERLSKRKPTGAGWKSISIRDFGSETSREVGYIFTVDETMRFAEMGVMRGLEAEDVKKSRKAKYNKRYVSRYNPITGDTHRPAMMMEIRHLQSRLGRFLSDFYGEQMEASIMEITGDSVINLQL